VGLAVAKERLHALQQRLQLGTLEQLAKKGAAGSQALVSKIEALLCVLCEPELVEGAVSAAVWRDVAHNQVSWASEGIKQRLLDGRVGESVRRTLPDYIHVCVSAYHKSWS
jgi:hypothetical protein